MASSSSFTASSSADRAMLGSEVTPLGEGSSSERTVSLFGGEESLESTLSLPLNEPPRAPINVYMPITPSIPRKRKKS